MREPTRTAGQPSNTRRGALLSYAVALSWAVVLPAQISQTEATLIDLEPPLAAPEPNANLGFALATGDFDGDGDDDLAAGAPGFPVGGGLDVGTAFVLPGTPDGFDIAAATSWRPSDFGWGDQHFLRFATSLAAGDFDSDGIDDLAFGAPLQYIGSVPWAGAVYVVYGPVTEASPRTQVFHRPEPGAPPGPGLELPGEAWMDARLGEFLAAGDFDGDGADDLVVGARQDTVEADGGGFVDGAGSVVVLYGEPGVGLGIDDTQTWTLESIGLGESLRPFDWFGSSFAVGRFRGGAEDDLAIGVPGRDVADENLSGAVVVLHGSPTGLTAAEAQFWHQDSPGIADEPEQFDRFGNALTAGDFDGDGLDDLAVNARDETLDGLESAGAVHVLYAGVGGLTADGSLYLTDGDLPGGETEAFERFGFALAAGDLDFDNDDELILGVPYEAGVGPVPTVTSQGHVVVLDGAPTGLDLTAPTRLWQHLDLPEPGDNWGFALALGRFHDGAFALAVGAPGESTASLSRVGSLSVKKTGVMFLDGFESGDTSAWSTTVR